MKISNGVSERKKHKIKEERFNQKSELLERERDLDLKKIRYLQDLFWELSSLRPVGPVIQPIDPLRVESHLRLSGKTLTQWEYNVISEMDLIFRSKVMENNSGKAS